MGPRDCVFVREPEWQHRDAGEVSVAQEIALHEPLSGIGAAAAIIGNYSCAPKKPRGRSGNSTAGQGRARAGGQVSSAPNNKTRIARPF